MNTYELFDKYIEGTLSEEEHNNFEGRLESDKNFAQEFELYLITVNGIIKEEENDCVEFGVALKSLTKEELEAIVGKKKRKGKLLNLNRYLWPLSSAAILIIAFTLTLHQQRINNNKVDNLIFAFSPEPIFVGRGGATEYLVGRGGAAEDLETIEFKLPLDNEGELKAFIPQLKDLYANSQTEQEQITNGKGLAMVYLKCHNRKDAVKVLRELIEKFKNDEHQKESVEECKKILKYLEG